MTRLRAGRTIAQEPFEWDEAKAKSNFKKHGIAFADATWVFRDVFAVDNLDPFVNASDESRFLITGMVNTTVLTVVYTERGARTRIISARKATGNEERNYYSGQMAQ